MKKKHPEISAFAWCTKSVWKKSKKINLHNYAKNPVFGKGYNLKCLKSRWFLELIQISKIESPTQTQQKKTRIHQLRGIIKRKEAFSSKEHVIHQLRRNIKRWTKCFHQKNLKYPNFKAARIEAFSQSSGNTNYNNAWASLLFLHFPRNFRSFR